MAILIKNGSELAEVITSMPYGELMSVAEDLSGMIEKGVCDAPKSKEEFASILWDWAEAHDAA